MQSLILDDNASGTARADASVSVSDGAAASLSLEPSGPMKVRLRMGKGCTLTCTLLAGARAEVELASEVGAGSTLRCVSLWLDGGRGSFTNRLTGRGARADDLHVFVGRGGSALELESTLVHAAGPSEGDILVKGVMMERSSADLGGMIRIGPSGAGAESFLSEHVLLAGDGARARAEPRLEIENNDVSSRHAASVSRIEAEKLFYVMSRGLPEAEARAIIAQGFLDSAIARIDDGALREKVHAMAMGRLGGAP